MWRWYRLQTYAGPGTICNKQFALFAKTGKSATHVTFLGKMTLNCHGKDDAYVLGKVCLEPCISDPTTRCCWVPTFMEQLFACCGPYGCCPDTKAPTPTPTVVAVGTCKDQHTRCPLLKKQLDAVDGSCFSSDVGELTSVPAETGLHLVDQCCASCQPGCVTCLATGHPRSFCTGVGACVDSNCAHPTLPAACVKCMGQSSTKARPNKPVCATHTPHYVRGLTVNSSNPSRNRTQEQAVGAQQEQRGLESTTRKLLCVSMVVRTAAVSHTVSPHCRPQHPLCGLPAAGRVRVLWGELHGGLCRRRCRKLRHAPPRASRGGRRRAGAA